MQNKYVIIKADDFKYDPRLTNSISQVFFLKDISRNTNKG